MMDGTEMVDRRILVTGQAVAWALMVATMAWSWWSGDTSLIPTLVAWWALSFGLMLAEDHQEGLLFWRPAA